jgi:hypothetical protein
METEDVAPKLPKHGGRLPEEGGLAASLRAEHDDGPPSAFSAHSTTRAKARSLSVNSVLTLGTNSGLILLTSRWMLFKLRTRHDA